MLSHAKKLFSLSTTIFCHDQVSLVLKHLSLLQTNILWGQHEPLWLTLSGQVKSDWFPLIGNSDYFLNNNKSWRALISSQYENWKHFLPGQAVKKFVSRRLKKTPIQLINTRIILIIALATCQTISPIWSVDLVTCRLSVFAKKKERKKAIIQEAVSFTFPLLVCGWVYLRVGRWVYLRVEGWVCLRVEGWGWLKDTIRYPWMNRLRSKW